MFGALETGVSPAVWVNCLLQGVSQLLHVQSLDRSQMVSHNSRAGDFQAARLDPNKEVATDVHKERLIGVELQLRFIFLFAMLPCN